MTRITHFFFSVPYFLMLISLASDSLTPVSSPRPSAAAGATCRHHPAPRTHPCAGGPYKALAIFPAHRSVRRALSAHRAASADASDAGAVRLDSAPGHTCGLPRHPPPARHRAAPLQEMWVKCIPART